VRRVIISNMTGVDMVVVGRAALASSLLGAEQIDECRVMVNPVILGQGNPMFQNFDRRMCLKLTSVHSFASGMAMLSYQP
jgi:dihydrofolate reductase